MRYASLTAATHLFPSALLLILIIISRDSYNHLISWLADARQLARPDITVVVVGNQMDRKDEREVTLLEASRFAQENGEWREDQWRAASLTAPVYHMSTDAHCCSLLLLLCRSAAQIYCSWKHPHSPVNALMKFSSNVPHRLSIRSMMVHMTFKQSCHRRQMRRAMQI